MARKNKELHSAKTAKNDEFYTQLADIEKEIKHYKAHFNGKVVFCNCDDPTWSEFWRYFHLNFDELGLKKLISTHYDAKEKTYKLEYTGGNDNDIEAGVKTPLLQNGDFRSDECIALLKEADIVVTNPPFSLFREYVAQLIEYQKHFIIIGNMNAITYKDIFPLIKDNKLWLGPSISSGDREFRVPDDYPLKAAGYRIDADGNKYIRVKGVRWFTNLDNVKRHEEIVLWKNYTAEEYPEYDNYQAINVDKTAHIPCDYCESWGIEETAYGKLNPAEWEIVRRSIENEIPFIWIIPAKGTSLRESLKRKTDNYREEIELALVNAAYCTGELGVPITFLDKYNPEQFEIVKFRKGNDEKDLQYTVDKTTIPLTDRQTDRQTDDCPILPNHCQEETVSTVMESWESPSHSLISTIQSNSLLSTHPSIESQTEMIASSPQEPMDGTSQVNESTHEFSYVKYCNGFVGVPITFLDKYNPEQFHIIGFFNNYKPETADATIGQIYGAPVKVPTTKSLFRGPVINGNAKYFRIIIKKLI